MLIQRHAQEQNGESKSHMDATLRDDIQLTEDRQDVEQGHAEREHGGNFAIDGVLVFFHLFGSSQFTVQRFHINFFQLLFFRHRLSSLV